jgi:fucose permease
MTPNYKLTRYACYLGFICQAIINNLLPLLFIILQEDYGLSYEWLGSLILFNFVTQLLVDLISVKFADRIGYRRGMVIAHVCCAGGLILLAVAPSLPIPIYGGLALAVMVYAVGGGFIEVMDSPIIEALPAPAEQKGANMAFLHSFYCWGQVGVVLLTTVLLAVIGTGRWRLLPALWAVIPFANIFLFLKAPILPTLGESERTPLRLLFRSPLFWAAMVLMLAAGASELTVSQWASMFAEQGLGLSKLWGDLAGPCFFAVLMGLGRVIYGIWGGKIRLLRFMTLLTLGCVVCYLTISLSPHPVLSLIACGLCGFSVSIFWPGSVSLTASRFPTGGAAMFAILAMCGDIGCSVGPWLAGVVAERTETSGSFLQMVSSTFLTGENTALKMGILVGTIFPLLLLPAMLAFREKKKL